MPGEAPKAPDGESGDGWEVWREPGGLLRARVTGPQHALSASARVDALQHRIDAGDVRAVLIDRSSERATDTAGSAEAYRSFIARNPRVPVAIITTDPATTRLAFDLRAAHDANLHVFPTLQAARAWLRKLDGTRS